MSNSKHQAAWRARLRAQGWRPVTLWLPPLTLSRLKQVCQHTTAPDTFTLRRALDFAFDKARPDYWYRVRQEWESRKREGG